MRQWWRARRSFPDSWREPSSPIDVLGLAIKWLGAAPSGRLSRPLPGRRPALATAVRPVDRGRGNTILCGCMSLHPPGFIEPCLPTGSRTAPTGPQWAYEIKHDGFRFICHRDGDRVRVFSRTRHEWGAQLPGIAAALRALPAALR
jgi:ATP-dependent DNA ligase